MRSIYLALSIVVGCCFPFTTAADPIKDYLDHQMASGWPMHGEAYSGGTPPQWSGPQFAVEIQEARQAYWKAYLTGVGKAEAAQKFGRMLAEKDLYCLMMAILLKEGSAEAQLFAAFTELDGGIPLGARKEFYKWFEAIKRRTEGREVQDPLQAWKFISEAMAQAEPQRQMYVIARDFVEFDRAGIQLPPKAYALMFLLRFPEPKTTEETARIYENLVATFGEERILELAEQINKAPVDHKGELVDPSTFGFINAKPGRPDGTRNWRNSNPPPQGLEVLYGAKDRWNIFRHKLLASQPRGYLLRLLLDPVNPKSLDFALVKPTLDHMILAYGEDTLDKAAETVQRATKRMEEGWLLDPNSIGASAHNPSNAIHQVLASTDPRGYAKFLLAETQNITSAEQLKKGYEAMTLTGGEDAVVKAVQAIKTFWESPGHLRPQQYRRVLIGAQTDYELLIAVLSSGPEAILGDRTIGVHPDYARWSRFKPGATTLHEYQIYGGGIDKSTGKALKFPPMVPETFRFTIESITPEELTLKRTQIQPPSQHQLDAEIKVPAQLVKVQGEEFYAWQRTHNFLTAPGDYQAHQKGTEKIRAAGRELDCRVYETLTEDRYNPSRPRRWETKIWMSDEVPGGIVKYRQTFEYDYNQHQRKDVTEYRLVEMNLDSRDETPPAPKLKPEMKRPERRRR